MLLIVNSLKRNKNSDKLVPPIIYIKYKVGGIIMQKSRGKNRVIISCLIIIMLSLVFKSAEYMWDYYRGPMYIIDHYVSALNSRAYEKVYDLLDQDTLKEMNSKAVMTQYYTRFYVKDNKLSHVSKVGWLNGKYILAYEWEGKTTREALNLSYKNEEWRICFPFKFSEVQIIAPNGSEVFLGDVKLAYETGIGYKKDKLLPGKYMLKVDIPDAEEKTYYQVLEVPQTKKVVLPYELGQAQIICAPYLEVHLDTLVDQSNQGIIQIPDVLVGSHELKVVHPEGYLEPVKRVVNITTGDNTVEIKDYSLSKKGSMKWEQFLSDFYQTYEKGISKHTHESLDQYFTKSQQEKQLALFDAWYIKEKNITEADVSYKASEVMIDAEGRLHSSIIETVDLTNKEYDDLEQKEISRYYKVILKWEMVVDMRTQEWKIIDRSIDESMIAFKDTEGKWVQY